MFLLVFPTNLIAQVWKEKDLALDLTVPVLILLSFFNFLVCLAPTFATMSTFSLCVAKGFCQILSVK